MLIVTCWFVEGYTFIYKECHSINVRVFRLVDCNVFSYLYQHLTLITQHPTEAVTVCDICMPEAFCEFETVRKKVLLNLWVLWEKEMSFVRDNVFLSSKPFKKKKRPSTRSTVISE